MRVSDGENIYVSSPVCAPTQCKPSVALFLVKLAATANFLLVAITVIAAAGISFGQTGRVRAVVVGVRRYPIYPPTKPLLFSNQDATLFEDYLRRGKAGAFQSSDLMVIRDEEATLDRVQLALRTALLGAQPSDRVYIFISARGVAWPGAADGYIGTSNLVEIKPESTGIPVSDLKDMIQYSRAAHIFFFADVCRDPPTTNIENRINIRLETLGTLPRVSGFLGSDGRRLSLERPDLQYAARRGFGVFGYSLVTGLSGDQPASGLFEYLKREIAAETGSRQAPALLGKSVDLSALGGGISNIGLMPHGPLLAALHGISGMFAFQIRQSPPGVILQDLTSSTPPSNPELLVQKTLQRKGSLSSEEWVELRDGVVATLASSGQKLVAEYGVDDMLPDDPLRVGKGNKSFSVSARDFQLALMLLPDEDLYRSYRQDLESRRLLCSGLDQIYQHQPMAALTDLEPARRGLRRPLPEVYNALGISLLEGARDYNGAIKNFLLAARIAPAWPYPRHNLALTYAEKGDYSKAEKTYRDAIAIAPDQPYLYYNLGLLLQRSNQTGPARRAYESALTSLTKKAAAYAERGAEWTRDLPGEAKIAQQRAQGLEKAKAIVENSLGALAASQRNALAAAAHYELAIAADPGLCAARHNLAVLEQASPGTKWPGAFGGSQSLLEENLGVCPAFHPSRIRLSLIYLGQGDLGRARSGFETVLAEVPGNIEAKKGLAAVLARQKQFAPAIELWNGLIDAEIKLQQPNAGGKSNREVLAEASLYEGLGDAYAAAGDTKACVAYRTALRALKGSAYDGDRNQLRRKAQSCK
jgi:tetratricopeptide (TPR) repeat protein